MRMKTDDFQPRLTRMLQRVPPHLRPGHPVVLTRSMPPSRLLKNPAHVSAQPVYT